MPERAAVVVGATGLVGGHLVRLLAADPGIAQVVTPVRRAVTHWTELPKVRAPVVDFDDLQPHAQWFQGDQLFICLGTTRKKAGSKAAFRRVDFDYVVDAARTALEAGVQDVFLVSSVGADAGSRVFYSRVKGEAEEAVAALGFRSSYAFRPAVLVGDREEHRPGEHAAIVLTRALSPLMVGPARRYRPIEALTVARAMVRSAQAPEAGGHIVESEAIQALGG